MISVLLFAALISRPDGRLHVWFLDVGHSNAVLIQTPQGAQILIDGGRAPSRLLSALGERLPFYDNQLELLIMTHPDEQDNAALLDVFERYQVGAVWTNGQDDQSPTQQALLAYAQDESVLVPVRAGYQAEFADGVRLEVLAPAQFPAIGALSGSASLILRLDYGTARLLLLNDADANAQERLLNSGVSSPVSVVQIPRHGAGDALSPALLQAIQPQWAVLTSDSANRLGDPHPDTLALLDETPLWRTDQHGTIHLLSDGQTLWRVD